METVKYKAYRSYASNNERGGDTFTLGYFKHQKDAMQAAKGQGFYGADGYASFEDVTVHIFDSFEEFEKFNAQQKIDDAKAEYEKALSKLTTREKSLLGLI